MAIVAEEKGFELSYQEGKQVQEILQRYSTQLGADIGATAGNAILHEEDMAYAIRDLQKDQVYVLGLIKLFD